MSEVSAFIGLDVHKDSIAVAVAECARDGEIRLLGAIGAFGSNDIRVADDVGGLHVVIVEGEVDIACHVGFASYFKTISNVPSVVTAIAAMIPGSSCSNIA